jgi:hypothetical protein
LVAFATAIIAVLWETKTKDKVGWRRVTKFGWLILGFAVGSLALNILKIREKNAEATDSIQVRTFAYRQIANGLGHRSRWKKE